MKAGNAISSEQLIRFAQATPEQREAFLRFLDGEALPGGRPRYALQKGLGVWRLVFNGREAVIADGRGVQLVNWLLKHPGADGVHASVLEVEVFGAPVAGDVGGVVQELSGSRLMDGENTILKERLKELRETADDEGLSEAERDAASEELSELLQEMGRLRNPRGQAERCADRVRKALRRFMDDLEAVGKESGEGPEVLRMFGEHLEERLWLPSVGGRNRLGAMGKAGCFAYVCPDGVGWED